MRLTILKYGMIIGIGLLVMSCKKTTENLVITNNDSASQETDALDELKVPDEMDQVIDDAVSAICISPTTRGGTGVYPFSLHNTLIDTSQISTGLITFYYYVGLTDTTRGRSGSVQIQLPVVGSKITTWNTPGVTATLTIPSKGPSSGYEIFYSANSTTWYDGTLKVTNVGGGILKTLTYGDSIIEKVNAQVSISHNDNGPVVQLYPWNIHKSRVFTLNTSTNFIVTTRGDTTVNSINNTVDWGTTSLNQTFYTSLQAPVVQNISIKPYYNPLSGTKIIQGIPEPLTITYGVDASGNPTSGVPYGYRLNWTNSSGGQQAVMSY